MKKITQCIKNIRLHYKWLFIFLIPVMGIVLAIIIQPEDETPRFTVKRDTFTIDLESKGEVKAIDSYIIKAPSSIYGNARIVKLIPEGEDVKPGDFLIQFDAAEFNQRAQEARNTMETAIASHESKLANIRKQSADLESQLKIEEYNLEQTRLRAKNAVYEAENKRKEIEYSLKKAEISYQQLIEKIEATKKINVASIRQSELQVEQARLKLQQAQDDLGKLTVISPASGLVVYKEVWDGSGGMSKIKVGSSPWRGMSILEIHDQSKMKVITSINEIDISRIQIGLPVEIRVDAVHDTVLSGAVANISALAHRDYRTKKNIFDVEVNIQNFDERLKPGMSASCRIIIDEIVDTLFIPIDALVLENEQTGVYGDNGQFTRIQTGKTNANFILIQSGLKEGDVIRLKKDKGLGGQKEAPKSKKQTASEERHVVIYG